jgi:hypothetical protein
MRRERFRNRMEAWGEAAGAVGTPSVERKKGPSFSDKPLISLEFEWWA